MEDAISLDELLTLFPCVPIVVEELSTPVTSDAFNAKLFRTFPYLQEMF
jgi:hypothetical protein